MKFRCGEEDHKQVKVSLGFVLISLGTSTINGKAPSDSHITFWHRHIGSSHSKSFLLISGHGILPGGMQNVQILNQIQSAVSEVPEEIPGDIILEGNVEHGNLVRISGESTNSRNLDSWTSRSLPVHTLPRLALFLDTRDGYVECAPDQYVATKEQPAWNAEDRDAETPN